MKDGRGSPAHVVGARVVVESALDGCERTATVAARKGDWTRGLGKYYVRYEGEDALMEEWVHAKRVRVGLSESGGPSGGTTGEGAGARRALAQSCSSAGAGGTTDVHAGTAGGVEAHARVEEGANEAEEKVKARRVNWIELGRYICDCWFDSPFPEEFTDGHKLFVCDFCLKYHRKRKAYIAHKRTCEMRHPPGNEIYRHPAQEASSGRQPRGQLRMFEVDGSNATTYCQNLCLIAKLFLDHKTLYYDVGAFFFYVLTEQDFDAEGKPMYRIVGYFSKEKGQVETNLACILTLPPYQRRGFGMFLIEFSYELSRREGRVGTPERPLSDLGSVSYKAYWSRALHEELDGFVGEMSIAELSKRTNILVDDIVATLELNRDFELNVDQGTVTITKDAAESLSRSRPIREPTDDFRVIPDRLQWLPHTSSVMEMAEKRRRTRLFQATKDVEDEDRDK